MPCHRRSLAEERGVKTIAAETAIHFRGELRRARGRALSDGEGYQHILFTTNPGRYGAGLIGSTVWVVFRMQPL